jgi:hypothetical protein
LVDDQQVELDDPPLADLGTPAAAEQLRADQLQARADAIEQRRRRPIRAIEARRRTASERAAIAGQP